MRERVRVSWGSALFSLASASPGRERERGQREEDGAGGKIRPLCPTLPQEVEAGRRLGEEGGGRRWRPGHSVSLPLPVRCARELGPQVRMWGVGEAWKRAGGGRTERNSVGGIRLAQKQNPTILRGATFSLALVSKPPQQALTSYTALFSKWVEVILGTAPGLGRPGTPSGSWSRRVPMSLEFMLGCS